MSCHSVDYNLEAHMKHQIKVKRKGVKTNP